jgi:hypothetical protein
VEEVLAQAAFLAESQLLSEIQSLLLVGHRQEMQLPKPEPVRGFRHDLREPASFEAMGINRMRKAPIDARDNQRWLDRGKPEKC